MFAASKSGRAATATDPYFPYVPLLLETTTTNGQQNNTFLDSSTNNFTLTRSGTPTQGSVTPYWPNGYWSNNFSGSGQYLNIPYNSAFDLASGDFTIEFWVNTTSTSAYATGIRLGDSGAGNWIFYVNDLNGNGNVGFWSITLSFSLTTSGALVNNGLWNHVAVTRIGSVFTIYINGVSRGTTTVAGSLGTTTQQLWIARDSSNVRELAGYLSNVRIVKGQALATGNFTPPTSPLTKTTVGWTGANAASSLSGTVSLLTCQSNRFLDNANNFTITATGTPKTQSFQPFSPAASYTTALYGGSIYNGTKTDTLTATSVAAITTFTGDFTFEAWVYPTDTTLTNSWGILDARTAGATPTSWIWQLINYISSPAGWILTFYNGSNNNFGIRVPSNTWSHVVLQRNGSTVRSFVNGVVDSITATISGTITGGSSTVYINGSKDSNLAGYGTVGYTSNLRIVNGTAVYATTGFTPPTAPVTAITNTSFLTNYTNAGIYDAAVQNNELTVGSAQASTTQFKWSPTSMKFNGTTDYLSQASNPLFALGANDATGNFTVECWIYATAASDMAIYDGRASGSGTTGFTLTAFTTSSIRVYTGAAALITSSSTTYLNLWTHVAVVRSAGTTTLYINGTSAGTSTGMGNLTDTTPVIGAGRYTGTTTPSSFFTGYIQDFRITKGIARYTANFTPPTAAFPTR
jgi:hypothetical protein